LSRNPVERKLCPAFGSLERVQCSFKNCLYRGYERKSTPDDHTSGVRLENASTHIRMVEYWTRGSPGLYKSLSRTRSLQLHLSPRRGSLPKKVSRKEHVLFFSKTSRDAADGVLSSSPFFFLQQKLLQQQTMICFVPPLLSSTRTSYVRYDFPLSAFCSPLTRQKKGGEDEHMSVFSGYKIHYLDLGNGWDTTKRQCFSR
jgi:hypothetical protein